MPPRIAFLSRLRLEHGKRTRFNLFHMIDTVGSPLILSVSADRASNSIFFQFPSSDESFRPRTSKVS